MRQIILDTETTGLNARTGDRIIEIGCVELVNRRLTGKNLHFYVNPERDSDPGALAVHGLTTEFLSDKPKFADNPHKGLYRPYTSPYINNTAIKNENGAALTGQTATGWGLFADPAIRAAIAVAFLNGQRNPTLESSQTDFNTLGMQWRCFHDFGVGFEDPNAAMWSAGA